MAATAVLSGSALFGGPGNAKGPVTAAIFPGNWDEQYRSIGLPALNKAHDVDLALEPIYSTDRGPSAQPECTSAAQGHRKQQVATTSMLADAGERGKTNAILRNVRSGGTLALLGAIVFAAQIHCLQHQTNRQQYKAFLMSGLTFRSWSVSKSAVWYCVSCCT